MTTQRPYISATGALTGRETAVPGPGYEANGINAGIAVARAAELASQLEAWPPGAGPARAELLLELAGAHLDAGQYDAALPCAEEAFEAFLADSKWEQAVCAARAMYLAGDRDQDTFTAGADNPSIVALGQGIWLAVSMPVEPELTVAMLQHLVDETPPNADGAAVAAAAAGFVVDLRCPPDEDALRLFTGRMLADVARRHSNVEAQADFEAWVTKLELDQPDRLLVRLRNVIDVLVQDGWRFDRDALRAKMPE